MTDISSFLLGSKRGGFPSRVIYVRDFPFGVGGSWEIVDAAVSIGHANVVNDRRGHDDPDAFGRIVDEVTSSKPPSEVIEGLVQDLSGVLQTGVE